MQVDGAEQTGTTHLGLPPCPPSSLPTTVPLPVPALARTALDPLAYMPSYEPEIQTPPSVVMTVGPVLVAFVATEADDDARRVLLERADEMGRDEVKDVDVEFVLGRTVVRILEAADDDVVIRAVALVL